MTTAAAIIETDQETYTERIPCKRCKHPADVGGAICPSCHGSRFTERIWQVKKCFVCSGSGCSVCNGSGKVKLDLMPGILYEESEKKFNLRRLPNCDIKPPKAPSIQKEPKEKKFPHKMIYHAGRFYRSWLLPRDLIWDRDQEVKRGTGINTMMEYRLMVSCSDCHQHFSPGESVVKRRGEYRHTQSAKSIIFYKNDIAQKPRSVTEFRSRIVGFSPFPFGATKRKTGKRLLSAGKWFYRTDDADKFCNVFEFIGQRPECACGCETPLMWNAKTQTWYPHHVVEEEETEEEEIEDEETEEDELPEISLITEAERVESLDELAAKVHRGDRETFGKLWQSNQADFLRIQRSKMPWNAVTRGSDWEIGQETAIIAFTQIQTFRGKTNTDFFWWIRGIAKQTPRRTLTPKLLTLVLEGTPRAQKVATTCRHCNGSGTEPGGTQQVCRCCEGTGSTRKYIVRCAFCNGSGGGVCTCCGGNGYLETFHTERGGGDLRRLSDLDPPGRNDYRILKPDEDLKNDFSEAWEILKKPVQDTDRRLQFAFTDRLRDMLKGRFPGQLVTFDGVFRDSLDVVYDYTERTKLTDSKKAGIQVARRFAKDKDVANEQKQNLFNYLCAYWVKAAGYTLGKPKTFKALEAAWFDIEARWDIDEQVMRQVEMGELVDLEPEPDDDPIEDEPLFVGEVFAEDGGDEEI